MKLWSRSDEWVQYANCKDSPDHTLPPERGAEDSNLPVADGDKVRSVCGSCRVRPECILWATDPRKLELGVWVAGRYIPEEKRQARRVRQQLRDALEGEYDARGEDV